jgi:hypothetical protein
MAKASKSTYQKKRKEPAEIEIGVEDFLPDFVDSTDRNISSLINARKEFTSVASNPLDEIKEGSLLPAQEFVGRYMLSADRFILIWQPGVGKLCGVVSPAEKFRYYAKIMAENTNIKRTVILLKGGGAVKQFKNKIKCECSNTLLGDMIKDPQSFNKWYLVMTWKTFINKNILKKSGEKKEMKSKRTSESKEEEELSEKSDEKIEELEEEDEEPDSDEEENLTGAQTVRRTGVSMKDIDMNGIIKEFSGTLFIIDEFHNLRSGAGVPDSDYTILQTVFDKVPNIKVVGSSATPMFDKAEEIIPSLNLILSKDKRLPEDLDLTDIEYKDFAKYIRGCISYVKSPSSAASPNYIENKDVPVVLKNIPKTFKSADDEGNEYKGEIYSPVYWIPISKSQRKAYKKLVDTIGDDAKTNRELKKLESKAIPAEGDKNSLYHNHRSILHGVFPGNKMEFEDFIKKDPKDPEKITPSKELIEGIKKNLPELSPKYDFCLRVIQNTPGKIFSYFVQIQGAYLDFFSIILDTFGYSRYTGRSESSRQQRKRYAKQTIETMKARYCPKQEKEAKLIIPKAQRYAIITGTSGSESKDKDILEVFNSPENLNGEYIKILIASPVFRETYSLTDVMTVLNMSVYWNISSSYQAEYRVIRTGSHRNYIQKTGDNNPKVSIYRIAMYDPENLPELRPELKIPKYCPVDVILYKMATEKDIGIHKILRYMKRASVDAIINYRRNVLSLTENLRGSKDCDYQECKYPIKPRKVDTYDDNFEILYSDDIVKQILDVIKSIFQINSSIYRKDLENLICDKLFPNANDDTRSMIYKYIYLAMYECIYNNQILTDFFGFPVVCNRNGDFYYISRNGLNGYGDTSYMNTSYFVENNEILKYVKYESSSASYKSEVMKNIVQQEQKMEQKKFVVDPRYVNNPVEIEKSVYNTIEKKIDSLTKAQKIVLLETALLFDATCILTLQGDTKFKIPEISKEEFDTYQVAKQMFKGYYFCINNPKEAIDKKTSEAKNRGEGKKGRKAIDKKVFEIKKIDDKSLKSYLKEIPAGEKENGAVYIHFMNVYYDPLKTKYNIVANYYNPKDTRYLDLSYKNYTDKSLIWRESTQIQKYIFGNIVQLLNISKIDYIKGKVDVIYGFILSDKQLRLIDLTKEKVSKKKATAKEEDKGKDSRTTIRGSDCSHYKILQLLDLFSLMYENKYVEVPEIADVLKKISPKKNITLKDMVKIIDKFSKGLQKSINAEDEQPDESEEEPEEESKESKKKPKPKNLSAKKRELFTLYDLFLDKLDKIKDQYDSQEDKLKYKIIAYYSFTEFYGILKKSDIDMADMLSESNLDKLVLYLYYYNTGSKMCDVIYEILEKNDLIFYDSVDVDKTMEKYLYKFV